MSFHSNKQFTLKNNLKVNIVYLSKKDLPLFYQLLNELSKEDTFLYFSGEKITQKEVKEFIQINLNAIKTNNGVFLSAYYKNNIIGFTRIIRIFQKRKRQLHVAKLGIAIKKDFRNLGLGKILLSQVLQEAKNKIKGLRIITLNVFSENKQAINLYKKFGFKEYGRLKEGIFYKGKYIDEVLMYLKIK